MTIRVIDEGTITLFVPNLAAREWLEDNCGIEAWQWAGNCLAVEPRYAPAILEGFELDGGEVL